MKRIAILLVALLMVTGLVVAEDMETFAVAVSGSASATFGVDLDSTTLGFENSTTVDVTVTFYPKGNEASMGESEWYGEIKFKDIEVKLDDDSGAVANITFDMAQISNGSVYVKIAGAPSDAVDYADPIEDADYDNGGEAAGAEYDFDPDEQTDADVAATGTITNDAGITIGYKGGMINDIALGIISEGTWESTSATNNVDNEFGIDLAVDVQLVPDLLSLGVGVFYSALNETTGDPNLGFGVSPKVTMGGVTFDIGFDGLMPGMGDLVWEADTNLTYDFDEDGNTSVTVGAYYTDGDADAKFVFEEDGEEGMVPGLGTVLNVRILDLIGDDVGGDGELDYRIALDLDYTTNGLKPYLGVDYLSYADGVLGVTAGVELGADFTGIEKTTFTIQWRAEDLTEQGPDAYEVFDDNMGDVTIAAKVSF